MEFQRFTAPDPAALEASIADKRAGLTAARLAGDALAIVEHTADLGALLTTARREGEALPLLQAQLGPVEHFCGSEVAGWFWNAYATALQYNGLRREADAAFARGTGPDPRRRLAAPAVLRASALGPQRGRAGRVR